MAFAFPSVHLVSVANRSCISLGPRFGAGEAPSPSPTPILCGPQPPRAALPAHASSRTRGSQPENRDWGRRGGGYRLPAAGRGAGQQNRSWPRHFSELLRAWRRKQAALCVPRSLPPPRPRALVPPQSVGKQRPGAILGRRTDPKPTGESSSDALADSCHS